MVISSYGFNFYVVIFIFVFRKTKREVILLLEIVVKVIIGKNKVSFFLIIKLITTYLLIFNV